MPKCRASTLATGARQLVVQDAFEMMWCFAGSYLSSLTPSTNVMSGFFAGRGDDDLLGAGREVLGRAVASVKRPVHSSTMSTPSSFHGQLRRVLDRGTLNSSPVDDDAVAVALTSCVEVAEDESYFSRCASVLASVRSLTATKSMSLACPGRRAGCCGRCDRTH